MPSWQPQSWDLAQASHAWASPGPSTLSEVTVQGLRAALWPFLSWNGFRQGVSGRWIPVFQAFLSRLFPVVPLALPG